MVLPSSPWRTIQAKSQAYRRIPRLHPRHCERSEAIQISCRACILDCFVAPLLATTGDSLTCRIASAPCLLGLRGGTEHLALHGGVERAPGRSQPRGERGAELGFKAPHQRLAQCGIMRRLSPKPAVLAT